MKLPAFAKLNWDLRVLGKRPDGCHEIDSVMVTVDLADEITFEPAEQLSLTCSDPRLLCDGSNLVLRAAEALAKAAGVTPRGRLHLHKKIPMGGGMGGGSSDAATTLVGLNQMWALYWPRAKLASLAAELGSDVPFFLHGGWCLCRGRGERILGFPRDDIFDPVRLFLVIPELHVPTSLVYGALNAPTWNGREGRGLTQAAEGVRILLQNSYANSSLGWPTNDLLVAAQRVAPALKGVADVLQREWAGRWQMSGSGAVHFVLPRRGETVGGIETRLRGKWPCPVRLLATTTVAPEAQPQSAQREPRRVNSGLDEG